MRNDPDNDPKHNPKHDAFAAAVRERLSARDAEPSPQPPERTAGAREPTPASPDPSEIDRLAAAQKQAWGIGEDKGSPAAERTERPTASAQPPRPDFTRHVGLQPGRSNGPGARDHVASGVRDALADFVSRVLYNEPTSPEPGDKHPDHDKGFDR